MDNGISVLIHVGIDTVKLEGKGFEILTEQGAKLKKGDPIMRLDLDYLKEQKLDEFYLFTDTSCNYGFYEHQGMRRRCEKEHIFNINGQTAKMSFFIYEYHC